MSKIKFVVIFLAICISVTSCVARGESSSSSQSSSSEMPSVPPAQSSSDVSSSDVISSSTPVENPVLEIPVTPESKPELPPPDLQEIAKLSVEPVLWGPGTQKDKDGRPIACVDLQKKYTDYGAHFIAPINKKIYLTFDEGYENGYSAVILDVLKQNDVSAVFFVTLEYVKANPELIKRMIDEGHIVGNHSAGHPDYTKVTLEKALEATMKLHQYMLDEYDYEMTLFRFPAGTFNEQSLKLVQSLGYNSSFWSFAYKDWDPKEQMEKTVAFEKITKNMHDGAIYLLHAVSSTNAEILGDVIKHFRESGYEVAKYDINYDIKPLDGEK